MDFYIEIDKELDKLRGLYYACVKAYELSIHTCIHTYTRRCIKLCIHSYKNTHMHLHKCKSILTFIFIYLRRYIMRKRKKSL